MVKATTNIKDNITKTNTQFKDMHGTVINITQTQKGEEAVQIQVKINKQNLDIYKGIQAQIERIKNSAKQTKEPIVKMTKDGTTIFLLTDNRWDCL